MAQKPSLRSLQELGRALESPPNVTQGRPPEVTACPTSDTQQVLERLRTEKRRIEGMRSSVEKTVALVRINEAIKKQLGRLGSEKIHGLKVAERHYLQRQFDEIHASRARELEVKAERLRRTEQENATLASQALQADMDKARQLVKSGKVTLCTSCRSGLVEAVCPTCKGEGGTGHWREDSRAAVCTNRGPNCLVCGGTGAYRETVMRLDSRCGSCLDSGSVLMQCNACRGDGFRVAPDCQNSSLARLSVHLRIELGLPLTP